MIYLLPELIKESQRESVKERGRFSDTKREKKGDLSCQRGEMVRNEGGRREELLKGKEETQLKMSEDERSLFRLMDNKEQQFEETEEQSRGVETGGGEREVKLSAGVRPRDDDSAQTDSDHRICSSHSWEVHRQKPMKSLSLGVFRGTFGSN